MCKNPGTLAATTQASIGNVAAGSLFALLQSIAMGGLGVGAWIGAGLVGAFTALLGFAR